MIGTLRATLSSSRAFQTNFNQTVTERNGPFSSSLLLLSFFLLPSIIMTISSTLLALVLMPLCLWIYSRAWINTPVVNLMPFGAIILTLCSTLIPIGLGVMLRYRHTRVADMVLKVN